MAKSDVEKWARERVQVTLKDTMERWAICESEAGKALEAVESAGGDVFELLFAVSSARSGREYALIPSSQLALYLSQSSDVQVELYGLRLKHTSHKDTQRFNLCALSSRLEEAESADGLYADNRAGVMPQEQFRRSVYVHRRGPSPQAGESRRTSLSSTFSRPSLPKRKAESPLPALAKKPKVAKKNTAPVKTLECYFK